MGFASLNPSYELKTMAKQEKNVFKKSRGRPKGTRFAGNIPVRLTPEILDAVDAWADRSNISRSEAIRRLIEQALVIHQRKR